MLVYGECECFVMQMLYVCVLCTSCSSQCCVLNDLQFGIIIYLHDYNMFNIIVGFIHYKTYFT